MKKGWVVIAMLAMALAVMGQPVVGPFVVQEAQELVTFGSPKLIATNADDVDMLWVEQTHDTARCQMTSYSISQQSITDTTRLLRHFTTVYRVEYGNVDYNAIGELAFTVNICNNFLIRRAYVENSGILEEVGLFGNNWLYEAHGYETTCVPGTEGRWLLCGVSYNIGSHIMEYAVATVKSFSRQAEENNWFVFGGDYGLGFPLTDHTKCCPRDDGVWALFNAGLFEIDYLALAFCAYSFECQQILDPTELEPMLFDCANGFLDFQITPAGRFLVLSDSVGRAGETYLLELDTLGNCTELGDIDVGRTPDAVAYHEDYGFCMLLRHPARLMIARMDTNGVEVQPLGILYETDGSSLITDADVSIDDEGNVVALWCERLVSNGAATVMKIASAEWNTFLNTEEEARALLPRSISLSAYPNPFNSEVRISYSLPKTEDVSLTVYNLNGQLVGTLGAGMIEAGEHTVSWSPETGAGMYFVSLRAGARQQTRKILYLK